MRSFGKILIAVTMVAGVSAPAFAQGSATANADSSANILRPITLSKDSDLTFGSIVRPGTGTNSVVISAANGARSLTGGGTAVLVTSGSSGRATFTAGGEGGQTFSISVPATFDLTSGPNTLTVTLAASAPTGTLNNAIGSSGTLQFGVGGTLPLTTTSEGGAYTGSFAATVAYN
jgi:hypothetical protein